MDYLTKLLLRKAYLMGYIDGQNDAVAPNKLFLENTKCRLNEIEALIETESKNDNCI